MSSPWRMPRRKQRRPGAVAAALRAGLRKLLRRRVPARLALSLIAVLVLAAFAALRSLAPTAQLSALGAASRAPMRSAPFANCAEARAAGAAPVYRGAPGYGPHLDRDSDGIGCEPWRPRRARR
ncbi:MAG: excalibur calcium-binding domain-containing protein [Hyphomonadaceae bacterium]|nr:excalibur calcium-binding domain-containing protein [Hyphomonadaceae bacterium]